MNIRAVAEAAYQCELAANAYTVAGDAAAARADTAPELIHIAVDGQVSSAEPFLVQFGQEAAVCTALTAGPMEALVVSPDAVLLTYPLAIELDASAPAATRFEQVSILWRRGEHGWQVGWIHASPLADPAPRFADGAACGQLASVTCADEALGGNAPTTVEETTLAERKWEVINCERSVVQQVVDHDVAGASAVTWAGLISVETDGRRLGHAEWLAFVGDWKRSLEPPRYGPMQLLTVSPTAMLVAYTLEVQGVYDGQPFILAEALSALWVWRGGRWQVVFMQATLRAPAVPHPLA